MCAVAFRDYIDCAFIANSLAIKIASDYMLYTELTALISYSEPFTETTTTGKAMNE